MASMACRSCAFILYSTVPGFSPALNAMLAGGTPLVPMKNWNGSVAAWDGLRQLLHGRPPPIYFNKAGGDPLMVAGQNLMLFGFLVLGFVAFVGVVRRLPFAYAAYTFVSIAPALSYPITPQPLAALVQRTCPSG